MVSRLAVLKTLVLAAGKHRKANRSVITRVLVVVPCKSTVNSASNRFNEIDIRRPFMFLYRR